MLKLLRFLAGNLGLLLSHVAEYGPLLKAEGEAVVAALLHRVTLFLIALLLAQAALIGFVVSVTLWLTRLVAPHWQAFAAPAACLALALAVFLLARRCRAPSLSGVVGTQLSRDLALLQETLEARAEHLS
ncbi:MAG: hypothetical protein KGL12_14100 [Rhodospirillales bacterium]|nr:hypothetical protein [Rhodospirillales bacterium]